MRRSPESQIEAVLEEGEVGVVVNEFTRRRELEGENAGTWP
ncbi:MAG TPA: hypothetical protein VMA54_18305 [Steroidobacteraceae bacterium]|nr:hypothetical protein [Steroidobacteraceae bacterium]